MFDVSLYYVIEKTIYVIVVVLYGMIAVWAVNSSWHWFARVAIVAISLSAILALPAYEVTVELATAVAMFSTGLLLWRDYQSPEIAGQDAPLRTRNLPRISLRDVFLFTVALSAGLAVIVRAPNRNPFAWLFTLIDGAVFASMGLACVWLAAGRARLIYRLAAAPLIIAFNIIATQAWLYWFTYGLTSFSHNRATPKGLNAHWEDRFRRYGMVAWPMTIREWAIAVTIGGAAFIGWLVVTKKAGWFPKGGERQGVLRPGGQDSSRASVTAQSFAALLTAAIAALPLYVWSQLITPPALPPEAHVSNQNYQQLVEAADELLRVHSGDLNRWSPKASDAQFAALVAGDEAIWQRVRAAISGGCRFPWQLVDKQEDSKSLQLLGYLFSARVARGDGSGTLEPRITAALDAMRLGQMELHTSSGRTGPAFDQSETEIELWKLHGQMTAQQCQEVVQAISQLNAQLEPPEKFTARSRLILQNGGWKIHLDNIAWDLPGVSRSNRTNSRNSRQAVFSRLLLLEFAIHAFKLEHGRPPAALVELTPGFLEALPDDPFGSGPFKYKLNGNSHLLYSVGTNGVDDDGKFDPSEFFMNGLDIPSARFFPAAVPPVISTTPVASNDSGGASQQGSEEKNAESPGKDANTVNSNSQK